MIYYSKPMHLQKAFETNKTVDIDLSTTTALCNTVLSLPMHPYITEHEINQVCQLINLFFAS